MMAVRTMEPRKAQTVKPAPAATIKKSMLGSGRGLFFRQGRR